ncbi:nuclear transport factor 2 family protein [Arthrobacter sp. zg-Y859]|uniref:Nuclear transport factor 2 family protein n=1 Tax=Arthrobacter jinronghuae TaxID=2964609 RepID=A0ABT1NMI3_9MICC|nr:MULTISPECIES: nuclear transport factor 2 family protein [Arthrobacter]MCC9173667.1 nuclear transport factor 2 family protein [Arthrobacter sp. zg-Y179]MCC9204114.1 nuclear transport factor 2 family protein [Arthrobacter sp. zg-Y769]MCQ1948933.1 nuclear transport factor 2 family protein [Arthrobacter jinronghuae]MCQ1955624.1 nuclear transport factor 2 family protein [Arthrobacter jinronghuae]UWX78263.1 nuclear transport factor 2 family protein [Arthrobacter jinronghuae]
MTDIAALERRISRTEAYIEISNIMGRIEFLHSAYANEPIVPYFSTRPDTVIELPFGRYTGSDAAQRCFVGALDEGLPPRDLSGEYVEHLLSTPVIEVADDLETAKAAWITPGAEAHHLGWVEGNPLHGFWYWGRYHLVFRKEDGAWKIWKYRNSLTFVADYYKSFTDGSLPRPPAPIGNGGPDSAPRFQVEYTPSWDPKELVHAPEPYATFVDEDEF